jgi:hypothetical protein
MKSEPKNPTAKQLRDGATSEPRAVRPAYGPRSAKKHEEVRARVERKQREKGQ